MTSLTIMRPFEQIVKNAVANNFDDIPEYNVRIEIESDQFLQKSIINKNMISTLIYYDIFKIQILLLI